MNVLVSKKKKKLVRSQLYFQQVLPHHFRDFKVLKFKKYNRISTGDAFAHALQKSMAIYPPMQFK